uniref:Uncharacterized protein n=1 Tax=viral metagenome TaxID=1070528 RepID=A0A6H1ZX88_9ZZZZ
MTLMKGWILAGESDGSYTLVAPNGVALFNVSLDTLEMLARMFLDEVEDQAEIGDLREALYGEQE